MKYLRYLKPNDLLSRVKASGQNLLSLGFFRNGIGICVVDTSAGRSFMVPMLESSEGNFTRTPLETGLKNKMIKQRASNVLSLNLVLKRDSTTPPCAFQDGRYVLQHLIPLQVLKPGMSVGGVRNVLNKLITLHNIGGLLVSFDLRYFKNMKQCKYLEDEMESLDEDGQLLQRSFTFVDDLRAQKKVEKDILDLYPELGGVKPLLIEYPNIGEDYTDVKRLSHDLTKYRECVQNCYATQFLSDRFYQRAGKMKLERNKLNRRKQEKLVNYAERFGSSKTGES